MKNIDDERLLQLEAVKQNRYAIDFNDINNN